MILQTKKGKVTGIDLLDFPVTFSSVGHDNHLAITDRGTFSASKPHIVSGVTVSYAYYSIVAQICFARS